jgi:TolB-like protein
MHRRKVLALTLPSIGILLSAGIGTWYWYSRQPSVPQAEGIPVIAVLPFQDLTGDSSKSEIGRGIADAFMTTLATFPDFEVVSPATSFALADKPLSEIVKATNATFVVQGSLRRTADKLKINMQLIRGSTDRVLMAAEVEQPVGDSVSVQEAVASKLSDKLGGMTGILRKESNEAASAKSPGELTEYDYYILGHIKTFQQDWPGGREIWAKGLQRFPDSALLHCKMAFYYISFAADPDAVEKLVTEAQKLRRKSRLDEWYLHWTSAWLELKKGQPERAIAEAEATVGMAPYDTVSRMDLSYLLTSTDRKDDAVKWATYAALHDPMPLSWYPETLVWAYRSAGKWKELIQLAETESQRAPQSKFWYQVLYRTYRGTGQFEKAETVMETANKLPDPVSY